MRINNLLKIVALMLMGIFTAACDNVYRQTATKEVYLSLGEDGSGCMRYGLKSTTQMSVQVILYKAANGGYTPNKENSICH